MTEFIREAQWLLWLVAALVLGLLELLSLDFVFSMLVIGALAASGVALAGQGFAAQAVAFVVASLVALVAIRPYLKRWLMRSTPHALTNTEALMGRPAVALVEVTARSGQVKLAGEVWTARAVDPLAVFPAGADVTVVGIDGATALIAAAPGTLPPPA